MHDLVLHFDTSVDEIHWRSQGYNQARTCAVMQFWSGMK